MDQNEFLVEVIVLLKGVLVFLPLSSIMLKLQSGEGHHFLYSPYLPGTKFLVLMLPRKIIVAVNPMIAVVRRLDVAVFRKFQDCPDHCQV